MCKEREGEERKGRGEDKRNLYLAKEGGMTTNHYCIVQWNQCLNQWRYSREVVASKRCIVCGVLPPGVAVIRRWLPYTVTTACTQALLYCSGFPVDFSCVNVHYSCDLLLTNFHFSFISVILPGSSAAADLSKTDMARRVKVSRCENDVSRSLPQYSHINTRPFHSAILDESAFHLETQLNHSLLRHWMYCITRQRMSNAAEGHELVGWLALEATG